MEMCRIVPFVLIVINFISSSYSARILGVALTPSYSHQVVFQPIWRELSLRGHQVVVLTTDPIKDKTLTNLTEIDLSHSYSLWRETDIIETARKNMYAMFEDFVSLFSVVTEYELSHSSVQALIKDKNQHFDLVLVEPVIPSGLAFSERFNCPYIIISSLGIQNYVHEYLGNPTNPILYPDYMIPFAGKMSFYERLMSVCYSIFIKCFNHNRLFTSQQELIYKHFGNDYPPLDDVYKKVSMMFINTEPILHSIRPLVPAAIEIGGGMHFKTPQPLPEDIQRHVENATEGFIYFSLGTNVKSNYLPENTRHTIMEAFSELPYKILWKFEQNQLKGKPDNVFISKWYPQQEILRQSNIKLFITQGGLQSMEEAVYNGVPMIVMPIFGDQHFNAKKMADKGIALSVDYNTLDKTTFKNTILEVINNPEYRKTVEKLSILSKDQQTTGLERAVWWTEYVLRHKGAQHLRGPAVDVPLYQQYLLDIICFCLFLLVITVTLVLVLLKSLIKIIAYFVTPQKNKTD